MKHLHVTVEMTAEAHAAAESFFTFLRLGAEKRSIPVSATDELCDSLEEHLGFALRSELDSRHVVRCDAQLMMEHILALGTTEELLDELSRSTVGNPGDTAAPAAPAAEPAFIAGQTDRGERGETESPSWRTKFWRKPLCRSSRDRWLFGVCGGFAEFFGVSSLLLRILFVFSGIGIVAYLLLALMLPLDEELIPGQPARASGCLVSTMGFTFKLAMLCLVYLPVAILAGALGLAGASKVLFELGICGMPSGDPWSFFVIGLPGILSGMCNLVIGLAFLGVTIHFAVATFTSYALFGMNTRKLLVIGSIIAIALQGGLWGLSRHLNTSQAKDRRVHSFPVSAVKDINIETENPSFAFHDLNIEVAGQTDTATVTVEIVREASGRSVGHAGEALSEIAAQALMRDGRLSITAGLPNPRWWFYHYPELSIVIQVPATFPVTLRSQGKTGNGTLKMHDLSGPVSVDAETLDVELDRLAAPKLAVRARLGSLEGRSLDIATCSLRTNLGSIELERLSCGNASLETDLGSLELKEASGRLRLSSRLGSIELEGYAGSRLEAKTDSGSIDISIFHMAPNGEARFETQMGSIDLRLPAELRPDLKLETRMGHIRNEYSTCSPAPDGPRITAVTSMGSIDVRRAEGVEDSVEDGHTGRKQLQAEAEPRGEPADKSPAPDSDGE